MTDVDVSELYARIQTLEAYVGYLANQVGVVLPAPADLVPSTIPPDVVALARSGNKIAAIKRYRELTGCDLREAKDVVDRLA